MIARPIWALGVRPLPLSLTRDLQYIQYKPILLYTNNTTIRLRPTRSRPIVVCLEDGSRFLFLPGSSTLGT